MSLGLVRDFESRWGRSPSRPPTGFDPLRERIARRCAPAMLPQGFEALCLHASPPDDRLDASTVALRRGTAGSCRAPHRSRPRARRRGQVAAIRGSPLRDRSRRSRAGGSAASSSSASCPARADVCTVLLERHRLGGTREDLGAAAFDFGGPGSFRVGLGLAIEASNELEGKARALRQGAEGSPRARRALRCRQLARPS